MIELRATSRQLQGTVPLPASKSESNRALIIQALNPAIQLQNLSSARDTQTMIRLLASEGQVLDVIDAGTTMRFLTAFCAVTRRDQILTGTPRMCQRPIGPLVEALRSLGANILYWKHEGFPPLHVVSGLERLRGGELAMPGNVSSQFISAILLVAPYLEGGLRLRLTEGISSRPYLNMTLDLMRHFEAEADWAGEEVIEVAEKPYAARSYAIESDWSGASYWYAMLALADSGELLLGGLRHGSLQGDSAIVRFMEQLGVTTTFEAEGARLVKSGQALPESLTIDCLETPDLAQTLAVVAAARGIRLHLTGLHTLRIKETDRIRALQQELAKWQVETEASDETLTILGGFQPGQAELHTYDDHRMAMAFAPLALRIPSLVVDEPGVVVKSYPEFWDHLSDIGIQITQR